MAKWLISLAFSHLTPTSVVVGLNSVYGTHGECTEDLSGHDSGC